MTRTDTTAHDTAHTGPASWTPPRSVSALADLLEEAATEAGAFARSCLEHPDAVLDSCVGGVLACAETCTAAAEALRSSVGACWTTRRELLEAAAEQTRRCAERCEALQSGAGLCSRWAAVSRHCCEATAGVLAVLDEMLAEGWPALWPTASCSTSRFVQ